MSRSYIFFRQRMRLLFFFILLINSPMNFNDLFKWLVFWHNRSIFRSILNRLGNVKFIAHTHISRTHDKCATTTVSSSFAATAAAILFLLFRWWYDIRCFFLVAVAHCQVANRIVNQHNFFFILALHCCCRAYWLRILYQFRSQFDDGTEHTCV